MSGVVVHDNAAWSGARPALSVLIPFLGDDPTPLLRRLAQQAAGLGGAVEAVALDDGTGDAELTARLTGFADASTLPIRLIGLRRNEGRARGRNRLTQAARGAFWLFLDADMAPDGPDFLRAWLALAQTGRAAVAFGGFSLDQASHAPAVRVHRALARASECLSAAERAKTPEKYVYASNLLVRRDVFAAEAFDPAFTGWGWEDVEWAIRISRRFPIVHIDNPATHGGLDRVEALMTKFDQGAVNFARTAALHPDIVRAYPAHRAARLLKRLPGRWALRRLFGQAARAWLLPVRARALALRLYRAVVYADAL